MQPTVLFVVLLASCAGKPGTPAEIKPAEADARTAARHGGSSGDAGAVTAQNAIDADTRIIDGGVLTLDAAAVHCEAQWCGTACTYVSGDPRNCGTCGVACRELEQCENGRCGCAPPNRVCAGRCTAVLDDNASCGRCGRHCPLGTGCTDGKCVDILGSGKRCWDGTTCRDGEVCSNEKHGGSPQATVDPPEPCRTAKDCVNTNLPARCVANEAKGGRVCLYQGVCQRCCPP